GFKHAHWVGIIQPEEDAFSPGGSSRREAEWQRSVDFLYQELIILAGGQEEADRRIEIESKNYPKENRRRWIERARARILRERG
ncbi:MAG: hypothetical protein ACM3PS_17775, partial [Syntrophothermus sp.]